MQTSTPLHRDSRVSFRRSQAFLDITNSSKSKKTYNTTAADFEVDDELERSIRRNETDVQKRLSTISPQPSPKFGNEKEMKEHFQSCMKLFAENKISSKNAWSLKIIDYMRTVLQSQGVVKNSLQVASTSLDASAKIYGIRVDDIHSEVLKLASNMARLGARKEAELNNEDERNSGEENEEDGAKKKKKRKIIKGTKATVVKDRNSLVQDLVKVESGFFQTRTNLELSCTNNLFTKKLPTNHGGYSFTLLNQDRAWPTYDKQDPNINSDKVYPFNLPPVKSFQTCTPFANFVIDEWDPKQEDNLIPTQEPVVNEEVVFDNEGVPIPELDGSIHDLFANGVDHMSSDGEEDAPIGHAAIKTNSIAQIVDFRPTLCDAEPNDYTFMHSVQTNSNKLITQIWAGPSHWKLKHIRPAVQRCAGLIEKQASKPTKKARAQPAIFDDNSTVVLDKNSFCKTKRPRINENSCKCTFPEFLYAEMGSMRPLLLKSVYVTNKPEPENEETEEGQNDKPYNYENANDSLYCSQRSDDDHDGDPPDGGEFPHEESLRPTQNFLGDNLIDLPQTVENTYIPYAFKAKKMDMKKLKVAVWKTLVTETPSEPISDEKMYEKQVHKTKFSNMYIRLPFRITENMKEELSCPLAFVALLHLCNEQNLHLTSQEDLKDFMIEQTRA